MKKLAILFLSFLGTFQAQSQQSPMETCVYQISNVNVIPGNVNAVIPNQDVLVRCGKIVSIKNHTESVESIVAFIQIDGTGKYLLPSYADAHVHLPEEAELKDFFRLNLMNGVTTLRSMRGEEWHLNIDQKDELCPRLILGSVPLEETSSFNKDSLQAFVSRQQSLGFDFIKVLGLDTAASFDVLVDICKQLDFPLAGHCPKDVDLIKLANTRIFQSVEHLGGLGSMGDTDKLIEAVIACNSNNVYHCATLSWVYGLSQTPGQLREKNGVAYVSKEMIKKWEATLADKKMTTAEQQSLYQKRIKDYFVAQKALLRNYYLNGGQLLIGPDASDEYMIPGFDYHQELQLHSSVGISNYELIRAACYNLSEMFGETAEWGALRAGSSTDLVLLNSNPLEKIENAQDIAGVLLKGNYYSIEEIKAMK